MAGTKRVLGMPAFQGIRMLNRIQSKIFPQAYHTNENLLVCAPTGAGKTNIAMLTVLHEIGLHIDENGDYLPEDFKIVYVAPMKALAAEVTDAFSRRLAPPTSGAIDICFLSDLSIQEWIKRFGSHNIPIENGPVQKTGATGPLMSIYVRDPDGCLIEISNQI